MQHLRPLGSTENQSLVFTLIPLRLILFTFVSFACSSPLPPYTLYIPATSPAFFRSPNTEPQVSESIKSERRRARSFTEVNIKLQGTAGRERKRRGGESEPSVPNPPHRSAGDEGNILFWQDTILRRAPLSPAIDFFFSPFFLFLFSLQQ